MSNAYHKPLCSSVTSAVKSRPAFQIGNDESPQGTQAYTGGTLLELQLPGFRDQVLAAPAVVLLFGYSLKTGGLVDFAGGDKFTLSPQHDFLVAGVAGEVDAFFDQAPPDAQTTRRGFDQQKAQFGDCIGLPHKKH